MGGARKCYMRCQTTAVRARGMKIDLTSGKGNRCWNKINSVHGVCSQQVLLENIKEFRVSLYAGDSSVRVTEQKKKTAQAAVGPQIKNTHGIIGARKVVDAVLHNLFVTPVKREWIRNPESATRQFHVDFQMARQFEEGLPALERCKG